MKKLFLISIFTIISCYSFAQCSIKTSMEDDVKIYESSFERIYRNEDLENGIQAAYLKLLIYQNIGNKDVLNHFILINSVKSSGKILIVPRKILVKFTDESEFSLEANEIGDIQSLNNSITQLGFFQLNNSLFSKILNNAISSLTIIDTRTGAKIISRPYAGLIKEQADCIFQKTKN